MNRKFTLSTNDREPKPRSKRLRELGGGNASGTSSSTIVNVSGGESAPDPNSHTHANKSDLDKFGTDADGYAYLSQMREVEETDDNGNPHTNWAAVKEKVKAGYADRAAIANDLTPDSPVRKQFLSRLADDVAAGRITFEQGLHALSSSSFDDGISVGNYTAGYSGANIDKAGNAEVESITARSYLKVFELIYNRINALEGNTSFADVGTIDAVDGQLLTMRKRWDGDFTAFQPGDIVYGYVNDLESENGGKYYKSWARVQAVDRTANTLSIVYYSAAETPAGVNFELRPGMVITRWGNALEANAITWANPDYKGVIEKREKGYFNTRQSSFFISCEDGNLVELMGVSSPILQAGNYGTILGRIPDGLLDSATAKLINKDQPYLYARGIIVQDLIRVDYRGVVTRTANYRGTWSAKTAASETDYYRSTTGAYDTVTWKNCLWQCVADGNTDEPSNTTGSWVNMSGGVEVPTLSVWKIIPNTDIVTLRYDAEGKVSIEPARVTCNVLLTDTDKGTQTYSSSLDLYTDHGVKLYYSLDGATWKEFTIGNTEPLETEASGEAFEAETSTAENPQYLILGGDDIASTLIGDRIYFELRGDDVLARSVIPVVKDGADGKDGVDGINGKDGKDGIMVYPAGNYSADTTYIADNETSPVVAYEGNYYRLIRGKSYHGAAMPENRRNPAEDVANGGNDARWQLFEKFNAVFADVIMASFAKLGGAVFYGDYMFSQSGTLNYSEVSGVDADGKAYYRKFTDGVTPGTFIPNLMLNFVTGEIKAAKGNIKGRIEANSGKIGGFEIGEGRIGVDKGTDNNNGNYVGENGMSLYPSFILFRDNERKIFSAVGSNVLPPSSGIAALARFEHNEETIGTNYGIIIDVSGAWNNIAVSAKGNIVTNNVNTEYGVKTITLSANTVSQEKFDQSTWLIKCTVDKGHICLPSYDDVRSALGIGENTPFSVRLRIIGDVSCTKTFRVQGRNTELFKMVNNEKYFFLDIADYPYRLDNNAVKQLTDGLEMAAGDVAEFQLVYDGATYNAYFVSHRS